MRSLIMKFVMLHIIGTQLRKHWQFALLITVIALIFISVIGRDHLLDWDECVFAQEAKEMLSTRDFLTYHWNGVRLFEKPPLTGWIISFFYLFGIDEFTARLPATLGGISLLIAVYVFSVRFFNKRTALLSALILLSTQFFTVYTIRINSDIFFTLFTFLGVIS